MVAVSAAGADRQDGSVHEFIHAFHKLGRPNFDRRLVKSIRPDLVRIAHVHLAESSGRRRLDPVEMEREVGAVSRLRQRAMGDLKAAAMQAASLSLQFDVPVEVARRVISAL